MPKDGLKRAPHFELNGWSYENGHVDYANV